MANNMKNGWILLKSIAKNFDCDIVPPKGRIVASHPQPILIKFEIHIR